MTTCAEVRGRLDDYVDGLLGEAGYQETELHLAGCPACREAERGLRSLLARAAALPREREPGRDLWPGIAARLRPRRVLPFGLRRVSAPRTRAWLLPALATAAAALLALGTLLSQGPPERAQPAGHVQLAATSDGGGLHAAEREYARATAELMQALEARRASLPPETATALEENLRTIDQALGDIRTALADDPQNAHLARLLNATHKRKVALLQQLVKLTTQL